MSSFVGVTLAPLFLARGQPDKLVLKKEEKPRWSQNSNLSARLPCPSHFGRAAPWVPGELLSWSTLQGRG